ncbi:MAG: IS1634 family transposase [Planctomycetes bacterium]|nr:IS1634 family transposase [Planctomycetota bacterium]
MRRSYRKNGKVKHQTLGNLSHLPPDLIDTIRRRLRGQPPDEGGQWDIVRTLPHGHVAAVLGSLRGLGVDKILASRPSRERDLAIGMIVARVISPGSKLATARAFKSETAGTSLSLELGIEDVHERELYGALDWLGKRQPRIETKLARRHLADGTLVLYDVSGSYYTGRCSGLVDYGYNRDGKRGVPQIVYGLLCNADGCPIAVEVFQGNTADPKTLGAQIKKVRRRFGIQRVVFVGDRGMITSKRIDQELRDVDGLDWITALRADNIKKLASQKVIEPSLFDDRDLVTVHSPDYPGERLIVCRNPLLADERARKRDELLVATEKVLDQIVAATTREKRRLRGQDKIGLRVGKIVNRFKVGKHFVLDIGEERFSYRRDENKIAQETALDGLYVIRTSVASETMGSEDVVRAYKDLAKVERAFRCFKTMDLKIRPIYHWLDDRIGTHVFLCMMAYYVEWHMRKKLAPILFDDHERAEAERDRKSIVAPAPRSKVAARKDQRKRTDDDEPVHSFRTLLEDLGTLAKNRARIRGSSQAFYVLTQPTVLQARALDLLGVPHAP